MTTNEKLAKLKTLAKKAGESLFERATMAAAVLADSTWIAAEFNGDYDAALATVEADCFPDLASAFGLSRLLILVREFPTAAEWSAFKFNLNRLWAEHEERANAANDKPKIERPRVKIADLEEREERIKELEFTLKRDREAIAHAETEIQKLRRENAELAGEVKALNRIIEQMRAERRLVSA